MEFTKMEALGNDFIVLDGMNQDIQLSSSDIKKLCDCHYGIGADGVLVLCKSKIYDFYMQIFNSDGSIAKMCGNGIRCVAKYVHENKMTTKNKLKIDTLSGVKHVSIDHDKILVDMGRAHIKSHEPYFLVSIGNQHAVKFVESIQNENECQTNLKDYNVEFVEIVDNKHIKVRVIEKGVGETLACGSGACAAMYSAYINHLCLEDIDVELPGGHLRIFYQNHHVFMEGYARIVYKGEIDINESL